MPPVTTSLAPVTAALDSKEYGATKVIGGRDPRQGAPEGPHGDRI